MGPNQGSRMSSSFIDKNRNINSLKIKGMPNTDNSKGKAVGNRELRTN
jgi:hypothetical protein